MNIDSDMTASFSEVMRAFRDEQERCSRTSQKAYAAFESYRTTALARVFELICACGGTGATDDEVEVNLGMLHQTVNPCRLVLWKEGWIAQSGQTRRTRTGREAVVWVACNPRRKMIVKPPIFGYAIVADGALTGRIFTREKDAQDYISVRPPGYECVKMKEARRTQVVDEGVLVV